MSISKWLDHSASATVREYDVVIVGAGIAGLSVAYWMQKKKPNLKIAVLEKDRLGFGASGRNAGFVTCGSTEHFMKLAADFGLSKAVEIWKFSEENHRLLLAEVIGPKGAELEYLQTGSCTVAPSEERWEKYQEIAAVMKSSGIDVCEIDPSRIESDYGVRGFAGGIQYEGDGYIDPIRLLRRLHSLLKIDLYEGTEVFSIESHSSQESVRTDRGVFRAPQVVLTINASLPLLVPSFRPLVVPGRGQILMTEPLPTFVKGPCYLTKHLAYFRQLPTGELIVGGFRNLAREAETTYADEVTPLIQNALMEFVRAHFPLAARAEVRYRWSGVMGFTPDGQMLVGPAGSRVGSESSGLQVIAGCSGHGLGLSFHAAKVLVDSLDGAGIPSHLSLERFERS